MTTDDRTLSESEQRKPEWKGRVSNGKEESRTERKSPERKRSKTEGTVDADRVGRTRIEVGRDKGNLE